LDNHQCRRRQMVRARRHHLRLSRGWQASDVLRRQPGRPTPLSIEQAGA
jgi:hypothetical protein